MEFEVARRKLVDGQVRPNDVTDEAVIKAFDTVPREAFLPKAKQPLAYSELVLKTVEGRAIWSARDMSKVLQALEPKATDLALVIAAGEGYASALMQHIVDTVIALESDETVSEEAGERLLTLGYDRIAYVTGDLKKGFPSEGPYDVIFVNGLVEYVPDEWLKQLKPGGRLGVVVGNENNGHVRIYTASATAVSYKTVFECVPPVLAEFKSEPEFQF